MGLFFVGGTAGTGKSHICRILKELGYEAYDIDDDGLARWQHNQTGYIHPKSSVKSHQRTPNFLVEHSWNVPRQHIADLACKAAGRPVFLCGSIANEDELHDLFTAAFALHVDEETLKHRLATRTTNDWGKKPHELQQTLQYHSRIYEKYEQQGDIIVDSSKPIDEVVETILNQAYLRDSKPGLRL